MKNKAIIIGGTSGIGFALAKLLIKKNYDLLIVSKNKKKLIKTKSQLLKKTSNKVETFNFNLSKDTDFKNFIKIIGKKKIKTNFVFNSIGLGAYEDFIFSNEYNNSKMIEINLNLFLKINKHFSKHMLSHGQKSYLVNIGSLAGFVPNINNLVYASCKKFIEVFTIGLRERLNNTNISVSLLVPGQVNTNFIKKSGFKKSNLSSMKPEEVANYSLSKIFNGKKIIIPGIFNYFSYLIFKIFPSQLVYSIYKILHKS